VTKQREARQDREHFDPQIRSARWKWEDQEKDRLSQKLHGVGYEDSPLEQQQWNEQIGYPAGDRADAMQRGVRHLPRSEQLKYWRGLHKQAGEIIRPAAGAAGSAVVGGAKRFGKSVVERPIATVGKVYGAVGTYGTIKGGIGTMRAARGDIQSAQNAHQAPTQAGYMGAKQRRPNPARISQTGSY